MDKQDWYDMGAQIGDLVQSAIDSKNFRQLNQTITDTIRTTAEMVQKNKASGKTAYQQAAEKKAGQRPVSHSIVKGPAGKTAGDYKGIVFMGVGYSFMGVFGVLGAISLALSGIWGGFGVPALVFFLAAAGFACMGMKGSILNARVKRYKRYLQIMGERDVCTIEELAAGTGKTRRFVTGDLKRMMSGQMFPDGAYLDREETCLITSRKAYRQYQETMGRYQERKNRETLKEEAEEQAFGKLSREVREIVKEGREFIFHIHQRNDEIGDPLMSEKLDRLERVVTRIFDQVADKPENAPDLHKMMSYYLPITRKLVDAYREMDEQQVEGENIRKTKQEIEDSLDTINDAFENLLDSFFQDTAWDISSDISVLHTMMAQDGLMKQDFGADGRENPGTGKAEDKKGEPI